MDALEVFLPSSVTSRAIDNMPDMLSPSSCAFGESAGTIALAVRLVGFKTTI